MLAGLPLHGTIFYLRIMDEMYRVLCVIRQMMPRGIRSASVYRSLGSAGKEGEAFLLSQWSARDPFRHFPWLASITNRLSSHGTAQRQPGTGSEDLQLSGSLLLLYNSARVQPYSTYAYHGLTTAQLFRCARFEVVTLIIPFFVSRILPLYNSL